MKQTTVTKLIIVAFLILGMPVLSKPAQAQLPPQIQADRFLIAAKKAVDANNHKLAIEKFEQIIMLDVSVPPEFWYFYATSLKETGKSSDARDALIAYLTETGQSGNNYVAALEGLNSVEQEIKDENSRLAAERHAANAKIESDKQAVIAAKNARIQAKQLRQAQIEQDRLARIAKEKAAAAKERQEQLKSCDENGHTVEDSLKNCALVGARYELGSEGYPKDLEKAAHYYFKSCHKKEEGWTSSHEDDYKVFHGCYGRIRMIQQGYDIPKNPEVEIYEIISNHGSGVGIDRHFNMGVLWARGVNYADGSAYIKSNSIVSKLYYAGSCKNGNRDGCKAAEAIIPDTLQQAIDFMIKCGRWTTSEGASLDAYSCYKFAEIMEEDESVYAYLSNEFVNLKVQDYIKDKNVSFYTDKIARVYSYKPSTIHEWACDDYKHPDSCFKDAEYVYQANDGKVNMSYFEQWGEVFHHYEIACKATNSVAVNKVMACKRREAVKMQMEKYLKVSMTHCLDPENRINGCATIATAHKKGIVFPQDNSKALEYQLRDCIKVMYKYFNSCQRAEQFADKEAIMLPPDFPKQAEYYAKACDKYPTLFCLRAGEMYEAGDGITADLSTAKKYYKIMIKQQKKICKGAGREHESCAEYERIKTRYGKK